MLALLFFTVFQPVFAQSAVDLTPYEQRLFNHAYADEPLAQRLARLEGVVFGESQAGNDVERQNRLIETLEKNRPVMGQPAIAGDDTATSHSPGLPPLQWGPASPTATTERPFAPPQPAAPPDATDYPTVTALEREVFGRDFIREDIRHRLTRLENRTFGTSDPNAQLVDRVDRLLSRYPGVTAQSSPSGVPVDIAQTAAQPSNDRSRDIHLKVDALERRVFNGKTHPNELLTERLDRLEKGLYGKNYAGESPDTRLNRLLGGFQVVPANGIQSRPAFQRPPLYQPPSGVGGLNGSIPPQPSAMASPRQNIAIGTAVSGNSTYQFSPELLSMLPPDVQTQLSGGRSGGTVAQAPGMVVIEEQTQTVPSGFQPFGGQPMGYSNQYAFPGMQTQSRTTTLIQPNGGSAVYRFSNTPVSPPIPAYTGNPALLQSLANLELQTFGWINPADPPYVRLARLESAMMGRTYAGYPDLQRLSNLQNAWQYRSGARMPSAVRGGVGGVMGNALLMNVPAMPPGSVITAPYPGTTALPAW